MGVVLWPYLVLVHKEELNRRHFRTQEELKRSAFVYIEGFYNPKRPHSANNNLSPDKKGGHVKKTHHAHIMIPSLFLSVFLTKVQPSARSGACSYLPYNGLRPHMVYYTGSL